MSPQITLRLLAERAHLSGQGSCKAGRGGQVSVHATDPEAGWQAESARTRPSTPTHPSVIHTWSGLSTHSSGPCVNLRKQRHTRVRGPAHCPARLLRSRLAEPSNVRCSFPVTSNWTELYEQASMDEFGICAVRRAL